MIVKFDETFKTVRIFRILTSVKIMKMQKIDESFVWFGAGNYREEGDETQRKRERPK